MSTSRGINVKDVASDQFVVAYAAHIKRIGKIEVPKWADLVKTAAFKELAPYDQDWYYIRAGAPWPSTLIVGCRAQGIQLAHGVPSARLRAGLPARRTHAAPPSAGGGQGASSTQAARLSFRRDARCTGEWPVGR